MNERLKGPSAARGKQARVGPLMFKRPQLRLFSPQSFVVVVRNGCIFDPLSDDDVRARRFMTGQTGLLSEDALMWRLEATIHSRWRNEQLVEDINDDVWQVDMVVTRHAADDARCPSCANDDVNCFLTQVDGVGVGWRPFVSQAQLMCLVANELHAATVVTAHCALVRKLGDAPLMHECTESEPVRRLFAHVDFECRCCTGAGDDEHGDFAADDRSRIVRCRRI